MPHDKNNVSGAMFDVRPVDDAGRLNVELMSGLFRRVNLRRKRPLLRMASGVNADAVKEEQAEFSDVQEEQIPASAPETILAVAPGAVPAEAEILFSSHIPGVKGDLLHELEEALNVHNIDAEATLARAGVFFHKAVTARPRHRRILPSRTPVDFRIQNELLREISRPLPSAVGDDAAVSVGREDLRMLPDTSVSQQDDVLGSPVPDVVDAKLRDFDYTAENSVAREADRLWVPRAVRSEGRMTFMPAGDSGKKRLALLGGIMLLAALAAGGIYIFSMKGRVIEQGNTAVRDLEKAKAELEQFNFQAATEEFNGAYEEFSKISETINVFGASIGNIISGLPGGSAYKSARDIVEVGKLVSEAGRAMSGAVVALSKSGWILNPQGNSRVLMGEIILPLKNALSLSAGNIAKADSLLAQIDVAVLPEDKREVFEEFKTKLPAFQELFARSGDYVAFLERLIGGPEERKILFLFENASELRPAGGFPGTYGVATFQDGRLADFFADDVYNLDGQLKELIVPPRQLQHITPNWAMRDANWFIDFPTSAIKVTSFFEKEAGYGVDGVIALNPDVVSQIIDAVGPIPMPKYNVTLNGENFLPAIQKEVEYGDGKKINKPKQIVSDLAPILVERLASADKKIWPDILDILFRAMERKDILLYFRDPALEQFALKNGFGGQVIESSDDFLMTTFSNIKGSKTDAVTDSAVRLTTGFDDGKIIHRLSITRTHMGGTNKYGFYNRQNSSYVRILVPADAEFIDITGNSRPVFEPLIAYAKTDFIRDPDLTALEAGAVMDPSTGVSILRESGKKEFGFWMLTDPGEIKTVELEYSVPLDTAVQSGAYRIYVQKQPGINLKNFEFTFLPGGNVKVKGGSVPLRESDASFVYSVPLERDLPIRVDIE